MGLSDMTVEEIDSKESRSDDHQHSTLNFYPSRSSRHIQSRRHNFSMKWIKLRILDFPFFSLMETFHSHSIDVISMSQWSCEREERRLRNFIRRHRRCPPAHTQHTADESSCLCHRERFCGFWSRSDIYFFIKHITLSLTMWMIG